MRPRLIRSDLYGNCSRLYGDCSDLYGDLDECKLTDTERATGVDINSLVMEA